MGLIKTVAPSDRRLREGWREGGSDCRVEREGRGGREGSGVADSHGSSLLSLPPSVSRRDSPPFIVQCIEASNRASEGGGGGGIEGEGVKVQRPSVGRTWTPHTLYADVGYPLSGKATHSKHALV